MPVHAWGTDKFLEGIRTSEGITEQILLKVNTKTKTLLVFLRLFQGLRRKIDGFLRTASDQFGLRRNSLISLKETL